MARRKTTPESADPTSSGRIVIPLTDQGEIDWESVRPSQREQLLSTVNNDVTILEHVGMAHDGVGTGGTGEDGEVIPDISLENVRAALDMFTKTNGIAFQMFIPKVMAHPVRSKLAGRRVPMTVDPDIVQSCFNLTDKQHEELDPRALRLAQRAIPAAMKKNLDVWLLAGMFLKFQADNAMTAIQIQIRRDLSAPQQVATPSAPKPDTDRVPPNGHAPEPMASGNNPGEDSGESLEPGLDPAV